MCAKVSRVHQFPSAASQHILNVSSFPSVSNPFSLPFSLPFSSVFYSIPFYSFSIRLKLSERMLCSLRSSATAQAVLWRVAPVGDRSMTFAERCRGSPNPNVVTNRDLKMSEVLRSIHLHSIYTSFSSKNIHNYHQLSKYAVATCSVVLKVLLAFESAFHTQAWSLHPFTVQSSDVVYTQ